MGSLGKIILKWIFVIYCRRLWADSSGSETSSWSGRPSGSIRGFEILDYLSNCYVKCLKNTPCCFNPLQYTASIKYKVYYLHLECSSAPDVFRLLCPSLASFMSLVTERVHIKFVVWLIFSLTRYLVKRTENMQITLVQYKKLSC